MHQVEPLFDQYVFRLANIPRRLTDQLDWVSGKRILVIVTATMRRGAYSTSVAALRS